MENKNVNEDNSESPIPLAHRFTTVSSEAIDEITVCENVEPPTPQRMYVWTQILATVAVSTGLLLAGFANGYHYSTVNSILNSVSQEDYFENVMLISNYVPWTAVLGNLLGAPLVAYVGRRYTIIGTGVPLFVGWLLFAPPPNLHCYFAGLILCYICIGVLSSTFSIYIAEIAQPEIRGTLGLLPIAFKCGGLSLSYFLSDYLVWSKMVYIVFAILVVFLSLTFFIPETPRWYVAKSRNLDARKTLQWFRGAHYNIEEEMQDITRSQIEADETKGNACMHMFYMENMPAVCIALTLMLFQHLSGRFIVLYYAQVMSRMYDADPESSNMDEYRRLFNIVNATDVVAAIIAMLLIDRLGRKILFYISYAFLLLSLLMLGVYAYENSDGDQSIGWLPVLCLVLHSLGVTMGYGSISWLILGEILPLKSRSTAASIITGIASACNNYLQFNFFHVISTTTPYSSLFVFFIIHIVEIVFVIYCVPETRGVSLEKIEFNLTHRVKNIKK